eukprot:3276072-Prymnesium_polylepis.1
MQRSLHVLAVHVRHRAHVEIVVVAKLDARVVQGVVVQEAESIALREPLARGHQEASYGRAALGRSAAAAAVEGCSHRCPRVDALRLGRLLRARNKGGRGRAPSRRRGRATALRDGCGKVVCRPVASARRLVRGASTSWSWRHFLVSEETAAPLLHQLRSILLRLFGPPALGRARAMCGEVAALHVPRARGIERGEAQPALGPEQLEVLLCHEAILVSVPQDVEGLTLRVVVGAWVADRQAAQIDLAPAPRTICVEEPARECGYVDASVRLACDVEGAARELGELDIEKVMQRREAGRRRGVVVRSARSARERLLAVAEPNASRRLEDEKVGHPRPRERVLEQCAVTRDQQRPLLLQHPEDGGRARPAVEPKNGGALGQLGRVALCEPVEEPRAGLGGRSVEKASILRSWRRAEARQRLHTVLRRRSTREGHEAQQQGAYLHVQHIYALHFCERDALLLPTLLLNLRGSERRTQQRAVG